MQVLVVLTDMTAYEALREVARRKSRKTKLSGFMCGLASIYERAGKVAACPAQWRSCPF
jgi:vacuolar-type H+-ATPase subunit B/Vma2